MGALNELRANPRLRLGFAAILAILIGYGLLEWRDQLSAGVTEYQRMQSQVARLAQQEQPEAWEGRSKQAQTELRQAQGRLWRNASTGQAQAQVQDWLFALMRQIDAKGSALRVTEPEAGLETASLAGSLPPSLQALKPMRARLEFNTDAAVLMALLAAFNDAEKRVSVDTLVVKPLKTEIVLTLWFVIEPAHLIAANP
jgi:hypothetical protein